MKRDRVPSVDRYSHSPFLVETDPAPRRERTAFIIRQHVGEGKGEAADRPLRTFTYFDIVRGDWRSFRPELIERIDPGYAI